MPEADQETTSKENPEPGDIAEEANGEEESLVVAISRGAGVVARSFSDGLQNVADAFRFRKPAPRKLPEEPIPELLQKLGELMEAHREEGYASLEENGDFWRLLAKLREARRKQIAERSARRGRKRKVRRVEDAVIEGEAGSDSAGTASKKKKKADEAAASSAGKGARRAASKKGAASDAESAAPAEPAEPPAEEGPGSPEEKADESKA